MTYSWAGWRRLRIPYIWRQNYPARDMVYIHPRPPELGIPAAITWAVFLLRTRELALDDCKTWLN